MSPERFKHLVEMASLNATAKILRTFHCLGTDRPTMEVIESFITSEVLLNLNPEDIPAKEPAA